MCRNILKLLGYKQLFIMFILDDIPSDAEAEARLHQSENTEALPEEDKQLESGGMVSSIGTCQLFLYTITSSFLMIHSGIQRCDQKV